MRARSTPLFGRDRPHMSAAWSCERYAPCPRRGRALRSGAHVGGVPGLVHTASVIRCGARADYPAVAEVFHRASLSNAGDRETLLAHPEHLILPPDGLAEGRTYAAEQGGSVVGFATWIQTGEGVELDDPFVDPNWRSRGIATVLVIRIVDVLRARGVSCLEVIANPHAPALYRQLASSTWAKPTPSSAPPPHGTPSPVIVVSAAWSCVRQPVDP
jgi:GNAT superfamily N-acetyltransferase